jgi:hypothetical protein
MAKPKARRDPLEPWPGPVMCRACGCRNQVRGKWRGNVFYPESDKCPACEVKGESAQKGG